MILDEKYLIVNKLIELMKISKLDTKQKIKIMNLVNKNEKATENQKERFCLFYGLNVNGRKNMKLIQIANLYGCSYHAIKDSIIGMKRNLVKYSEEKDLLIIKKIVNECEKEMKKVE